MEVPARTAFRVEPCALHQIPTEGIRKNSWAFLDIRGKHRLCLIDLNGRCFEHWFISANGKVPANVTVEDGHLFVRCDGRTFKYAPHGRLVSAWGVAPVTHQWCGPLGTAWVTVPGVVPTPVVTDDGQWVEVLATTVAAPTPAPPAKKPEPQPTPVDEQELREEIPVPPALVVPPASTSKGKDAEGEKPNPQPQKPRSRPRIA